MRLVPVIGDGNCLFRALFHIILVMRVNIILSVIPLYIPLNRSHTFLHFVMSRDIMYLLFSNYHFNNVRRNYTWGTLNELIFLGILLAFMLVI